MQIPDVTGLFDTAGLISMAIGAVLMRLYMFCQDRYNDSKHPESAPHSRKWKSISMAWVLIGAFLLYNLNAVQEGKRETIENATAVRELAIQTQQCLTAILDVVEINRQLTAKNDDLSERQRKKLLEDNIATHNWINEILSPPMSRDDPAYEDWVVGVTQRFYGRTDQIQKVLRDIQAEIDANQEDRERHPINSPICEKLRAAL